MATGNSESGQQGKSLPTRELVAKLGRDRSPEARAEVAGAIGGVLDIAGLTSSEKQVAQEIVRSLAADVERQVREKLSSAVAASPDLPPDVAKKLAADIASVAGPVLTESSVLSEADLIEVVKGGDEAKQMAIANRPHVSSGVADALVDEGSEDVVVAVVSNPGAELKEQTLSRAVDRFGESEKLQEPLVRRAGLPVSIAERMVSMVSDRLREELVQRHELPDDLAADLVLDGRERATLSLVSGSGQERRVEDLVAELFKNGRLTDSIVVRAVCTGDVAFLEAALAIRGGIPLLNARQLIHDPGKRGFEALLGKARITGRDKAVLMCAVDVIHETELGDQPGDRERFGRLVIERVLTTFDAEQAGVADGDANYLIRRLESYAAA